jgi:hypothetical protein
MADGESSAVSPGQAKIASAPTGRPDGRYWLSLLAVVTGCRY